MAPMGAYAATMVFGAWAYSMPNSPFRYPDGYYSPGIAAIVLPFAATLLGLLAQIAHRSLKL